MAYGSADFKQETVVNFFGLVNRAGKVRRMLDGKKIDSLIEMGDRAEAEAEVEARLEE